MIPKNIVYDNGPEYSCDEFAKFSEQYGFIYATSSPTHAQSMVSPKKRYKPLNTYSVNVKLTVRTLILGILEYLNTPLEGNTYPAQALTSRRLRSFMPSTREQLQPKPVNHEQSRNQLVLRRQTQSEYISRQSTAL